MLISRKVTEVSEIPHVNLRAGWKELTKPINRSNSSLVQDNHLCSGQYSMRLPAITFKTTELFTKKIDKNKDITMYIQENIVLNRNK